MSIESFEHAVNHAMLYEVGSFWEVTPEVEAGLCDTKAQKRAVGYVNDPVDPGGETKFGVAKNANPDLDIYLLDWNGAKRVYYKRYWLAGDCEEMPSRLAILHFDGCVNHGIGRASKFLQQALGVRVDGDIGPKTLEAIESMDEIELCNAVCDLRVDFYNAIVANKPSQSKFLKGWLRRISEVRDYVTDPNVEF